MLRWRQAGFGACMMLGPSLASHASTPKSRGETKGDTGREGGWEEPPRASPPELEVMGDSSREQAME